MSNDTQSRRWQITINNPIEKNLDHQAIKDILEDMKSVNYSCMADEIGLEQQTPHTHLFIASTSGIRFSTIKKRFPQAHIEKAQGTALQNRDYIAKAGKWADDVKHGTQIPDSFEENGEIPPELGQGYRSDIAELYQKIVDGMSNAEIMEQNPDYALHIALMDKIRQEILEAKYKDTWRDLTTTYIWGATGTGKTRGVMEKYGYGNVFRVTDYAHPFDRYSGQPVLLLDEFRSSLMIGEMLNYLDGYPSMLPARYAQRVACYNEIYIISNIDLHAQYPNVKITDPGTWDAFLRRINKVMQYFPDGHVAKYTTDEYLNGFVEVVPPSTPPFDDPPTPTQTKLKTTC